MVNQTNLGTDLSFSDTGTMIACHLRKPGCQLVGGCSNDREVQMAIDE